MSLLEAFEIDSWEERFSPEIQNRAVKALENGKVLFFPRLAFSLNDEELSLLDPKKVDPKTKNISYDKKKDRLAGTLYQDDEALRLKSMIRRYSIASRHFIDHLIPHYQTNLDQAKTSFRPVEIFGRKSSYRKDDTRLHVDSFPSNPTKGKRILRLFTNVNPDGKPRVWRVGEPFEVVARKFLPKATNPIWGVSHLLKLLKITKDLRTPYDHYMLQIHDQMKGDDSYQKNVQYEQILFPPGSSWMVYTDQVSHAAMSGQHVFEQTFHLPSTALQNPATTPLKVLEKILDKTLV